MAATPDPTNKPGPASSDATSKPVGKAASVLPALAAHDWRRVHLWQIQIVRDCIMIGAAVGLFILGNILSVVTVPLLLALLLAYLFEPVVRKLTRSGRVKRGTVALGIIVATGLVVVLPTAFGAVIATAQGVTFVQRQLTQVDRLVESVQQPDNDDARARLNGEFWKKMRDYIVERKRKAAAAAAAAPDHATPADKLSPGAAEPGEGVQPVVEAPPADAQKSPGAAGAEKPAVAPGGDWLMDWVRSNASGLARRVFESGANALNAVTNFFKAIGFLLFTGFLTAIFFYFFSTGYPAVLDFGKHLLPASNRERTIELISKMDIVIAGFVRGRLIICSILMVYYTGGYGLVGVPLWFVLGPAVGLLTMIPYAASIGMPIAMLLMALGTETGHQPPWWWIIGGPILVHAGGQVVDDYMLTPRIQGKTTNMDMPTILFASLAGGVLAGLYGVLVAIPVAACVKILLREVFWPRFRRWSEGKAPDFIPLES